MGKISGRYEQPVSEFLVDFVDVTNGEQRPRNLPLVVRAQSNDGFSEGVFIHAQGTSNQYGFTAPLIKYWDAVSISGLGYQDSVILDGKLIDVRTKHLPT